jgi:CubicO group peptidase (beta-lactamase class C family)
MRILRPRPERFSAAAEAPRQRPGRGSGPFSGSAVRASVAVLAAVPLLAAAPMLPAEAASERPDRVAAHIDRFLSAQLRDSAIPGAAVAVTHGDQVLMVRGYGHDSTGKAVTGDSLFRIASLSKSFTALAVMQLVDAGLLHLDDPVRQHLPEFEMADHRIDQVTVRELLNHSSGITDAVVPDLSRDQPSTPDEATTSLRSAHLAFTPGTSYSYANPNYQVAARLVEVLSGEPFGRYLRRHIFEPARMASTTSTATDDQPVPGLAEGHLIAYGHTFAVPGFGSYTTGDGGVVSSAADMARWLVVNANGGRAPDGTRIVSGRAMRLLHTPSAPRSGYALGWDTDGLRSAPTRVEHSGSLFTFTSEEALWPASGYGVVLLFNTGSPMMLDQIAIVHGVFDIIEGHAPPFSGPHLATRLDTVLAALTLTALVLGGFGLARAGRWARRRRGAPVRTVLGLLPAVTVLGVGMAFPRLAEAWIGRDVTWWAAAYEWPALVVFVLTALLAATVTLLARAWQWWHPTGASPDSEHPGHADHPDQRAEQEARTGSAVAIPAS